MVVVDTLHTQPSTPLLDITDVCVAALRIGGRRERMRVLQSHGYLRKTGRQARKFRGSPLQLLFLLICKLASRFSRLTTILLVVFFASPCIDECSEYDHMPTRLHDEDWIVVKYSKLNKSF